MSIPADVNLKGECKYHIFILFDCNTIKPLLNFNYTLQLETVFFEKIKSCLHVPMMNCGTKKLMKIDIQVEKYL